ncbi:MAG: tRNA preQ1(34) S-adenosylmethionine ribosyltransferase-isomerase QueA [Dehalococcoidia bacterium]|nr:tRNA preQ1(34) S-adenosylmethionine ribosyltransferase-isomerase QueA [Dehalococcoidia bacterium]
MRTGDFDYVLPPELIAQTPLEPRDRSRLMVLDRAAGTWEHRHFYDMVSYLNYGDLLVFNDSRVLPARLHGTRSGSGGKVEVLLLRRLEPGLWECLVKPAKRLRKGAVIMVGKGTGQAAVEAGLSAEVVDERDDGIRLLRFSDESRLEEAGEVPLPPYIHEPLDQPSRYQTVYARVDGSAAAPTAGLHFTPELLETLKGKGVKLAFVTIHIGLDTFLPVRVEDPSRHPIHREYGEIGEQAALEISRAKAEGRRVIAVGTSTVRLLEHVSSLLPINSWKGWVDLFILPGHTFRVADAMMTNFHLPRTTLLMLVSAFAGRDFILRAYEEAIRQHYRFYSFGDAMLVL